MACSMPLRATMITALAAGLLLVAALPAAAREQKLTLITHDSFFLPAAVLEGFEAAYDVDLEVLYAGDAGSMVNQAILTAERPLADVLYGIDNTFLSRALAADIFEPYRSAALKAVPLELQLDAEARVTPIDFGDVCLNLDRSAFGEGRLPLPASLEDLAEPALAGQLVVENPATSSPGLSFLLATIAYFGEGGWQSWWADLRDNDVTVTAGWEEAYYGHFSGGGDSEGDRPIVVSYAASPAAEVIYGSDPQGQATPTVAIEPGCFRQVEFAGILRGTDDSELAGALIDHLLSIEAQAELPLAMFVNPARSDVGLPELFEQHTLVPSAPLSLDPAVIDANREAWISEWTDIVLR